MLSTDSLHRSPRRHIDDTNQCTALVGVDIFGVGVAQFRLADQTTGETCSSGFSLQRFDQPVKRHIPMGTIFSQLCHPYTSLFVRTLCPKTDYPSGDHVRLSNQVASMFDKLRCRLLPCINNYTIMRSQNIF